jgi:hypothetical protein
MSPILGSIKRVFIVVGAWLSPMPTAVVFAGHHPGHGATESAGGGAALWIFLGLIAFVGIMALVTRMRK